MDVYDVHRLDAAESNAAARSASKKFTLPLPGCTLQEATDVVSFFYSKDAAAMLTPTAIPGILKVLDMFDMKGVPPRSHAVQAISHCDGHII